MNTNTALELVKLHRVGSDWFVTHQGRTSYCYPQVGRFHLSTGPRPSGEFTTGPIIQARTAPDASVRLVGVTVVAERDWTGQMTHHHYERLIDALQLPCAIFDELVARSMITVPNSQSMSRIKG